MDGTPHLQDDPHDRPETAEARQRRLAWEAEMIAEAEAEVAAGQTISLKAVRAWVESWDTDRELPPPFPQCRVLFAWRRGRDTT
jgi:hypothetical protein